MTDNTDHRERRAHRPRAVGLAIDRRDPLLLAAVAPGTPSVVEHSRRLTVIGVVALVAGAALGLALAAPPSASELVGVAWTVAWAPLRLLTARIVTRSADGRAVQAAWAVSLLPFVAAVLPALSWVALVVSAVLFARTLSPHVGRSGALRATAYAWGLQTLATVVVWFGKSALIFGVYLLR